VIFGNREYGVVRQAVLCRVNRKSPLAEPVQPSAIRAGPKSTRPIHVEAKYHAARKSIPNSVRSELSLVVADEPAAAGANP